MTRMWLSFVAVVAFVSIPALSAAQTGFANLIDHVHLAAPDQAKAVAWYHAHLGAALTPEGPDRAMLGATRLIFQKSAMPKPSRGSVLGSIGFSVADLDATVAMLQRDGGTVVTAPRATGGPKTAQVTDPWGTLIDLVQDPETTGLHHIELVTPDPTATLKWFAASFGGTVARAPGGTDGIRYGSVWLLARRGTSEPSAGHAIDHIGFRPANVDSAVATLKTRNVTVTTEPRPLVLPSGTAMRLAFIEGPDGVRIELVQRDNLP